MPEVAQLVLTQPAGFASVKEFRERLLARLGELEREAAAERGARGVRALGAHRVRKQKHTDRPTTRERRRGLDPRIAAKDKQQRIEALQRLVRFLEEYRAALLRYCDGDRSVLFPHGTYLMRVRFGVACASS